MPRVIVVGGGNAALCAAIAARRGGTDVLVLEKAPEPERGGNSFFTAGGFRFAHGGLDDLRRDVLVDLSEDEARAMDIDPYPEAAFFDDLLRLTEHCCDADLAEVLIGRSHSTVAWMREQGVRFIPMFARQAYKIGNRHRFWGGMAVEAVGGGPGLVESLYGIAQKLGIEVRYGVKASRLLLDAHGGVRGVVVRDASGFHELESDAAVLASGGFEANPEWRARYLGPDWELARVRGTRHNTGDGIRMALEIGAQPYGHWSSCHAVAWDLNAPPFGDRRVGDLFQKHSYPLGLIVNIRGERFVDEGAELREEYFIRQVTKAEANTVRELAAKLEIDPEGLERTVEGFNKAVQPGEFNPAIRDGKHTRGISPPKSNWALPLDTPPYVGFAVTCGITFTFGGLRVNTAADVRGAAAGEPSEIR